MKGRDVVLGLLMVKDRSGYEIGDFFNKVFSHFFEGSYGMIYPTLRSLYKEHLIEKEIILQEGKPNKNVYKGTDVGRKLFLDYLNSDIKKDVIKSDFLMRMYFGEYLSQEVILKMINNQIKVKEKLIFQLEEDYEKWKDKLSLTQKLSYDIGLTQYECNIKVLKEYRKKFKEYER